MHLKNTNDLAALPRVRGVLLDLDGTLIAGSTALAGAARLLDTLGERCAIVSNNSTHTPEVLAAELATRGLHVPARRIVLAGVAAIEMIAARRSGMRTMVVGTPSLVQRADERGLVATERNPEVVLLARDPQFDDVRLLSVTNALREGAELVVANPDLWHPGPHGEQVPETGALLAAVLACTGAVSYTLVGKPEPHLFLRALAILGIEARHALMIGDNPSTDGIGAHRLGIRAAIVGQTATAHWPDLQTFVEGGDFARVFTLAPEPRAV